MFKNCIVLFHFGRSGSTVIAKQLSSHPEILWLNEIYTMARRDSRSFTCLNDLLCWPNEIKEKRQKSERFWGFEVKPINFHYGLDEITSVIDFIKELKKRGCHVVLLRRKNTFRRIISVEVARQTKVWHINKENASQKKRNQRVVINVEKFLDFDTQKEPASFSDSIKRARDYEVGVFAELEPISDLFLTYEEDVEGDPSVAYHKITELIGAKHVNADIALKKTVAHKRTYDLIENFSDVLGSLKASGLEDVLADDVQYMVQQYHKFERLGPGEAARRCDLKAVDAYMEYLCVEDAERYIEDFVSVRGLWGGFEEARRIAVKYESKISKGKFDNVLLRLMARFGKNEMEREYLEKLISNGANSLFIVNRYLSVLYRSGDVAAAIEYFVKEVEASSDVKRQKVVYDWAVRLGLHAHLNYLEQNGILFRDNLQPGQAILMQSFIQPSENAITIPVYCISLEADKPRWVTTRKNLSSRFMDIRRVKGVDGSTLPRYIHSVCGGERLSPSIIGCALSHIKALEEIINNGHESAIIVEDDVILFNYAWEFSKRDADIIFLNDRNSNGWQERVAVQELPVSRDLCKGGAYAYLVSRQGAKKMLDLIYEEGLKGHIDGQLIAYGIEGKVCAKTMSIPVFGHFDGGVSSRFLVDFS